MKNGQRSREAFMVLVIAVMFLGSGALAGSAFATEGGGGAYPNGAEDFMMGALPPPGTYFKNYVTYYASSKLNDNNGNDLVVNFDLKVMADVLRLIHVTNHKVLGANWAVHTLIPLVHQDVKLGSNKDNRSGLGDIIVDPIILGWHSKNFHVTAGIDIYIPTGSYNKEHLANIGRNYWTFEPVLGVTYLGDNGFELSTKFMYDINLENEETQYKSGQEFHAD